MDALNTRTTAGSTETIRTRIGRFHTGVMRVGVLGPLMVDGATVAWGRRDRVVLECIALRPVVGVTVDGLSEAIWGEHVPASAAKVVQGCIVRLRRALGTGAIERSSGGYRLVLHRDEADHLHFEDLVSRGRSMLESGQPDRTLHQIEEALGLWRGAPFPELTDWAPARIEVDRLVELLGEAEELRGAALLDAGQVHEAVALLTGLVAEEPTREDRWRLLAQAQYRAGRQADALGTLRRARAVLVDELGLDPGPALAAAEERILRHAPDLDVPAVPPVVSDECPYPGLLPYEITDSTAFSGREADTTACLRRLDATGVLAVVGPSGSGKSSLLRAGVAAALSNDGRQVLVTTPSLWLGAGRRLAPTRASRVLVLDQFEELLALPRDAAVELLALLTNARAGSGMVALGLRADRLAELSAYPELAAFVEDGLHLLGPMTEEDLRQAIEGPARQAGLLIEEGLVDLLLREVHEAPGALPLLSHVLRETWQLREGRTLTLAGYRATGGVRRAVAQSAENVFRELTGAEQELVRDLMTRLVEPGEEGVHVRRRVPRRVALRDDVRVRLVERLVGARLLTSDGDSIQIAHESLVDAWPRLRTWLDDDVEGLRIKRHISVAADSWEELGRPESELYRGVRQARAAAWMERAAAELTDTERDFLSASDGLARREAAAAEEQLRLQRRANQRLRLTLAGVALLLAVALVTGTIALTASHRAEDQALAADSRAIASEAVRAKGIDQSLLFAVAGMKLRDTTDTRSNLLSILNGAGPLIGTARDVPPDGLSVIPGNGDVVAVAAGAGLSVRDGTTLAPIRSDPSLLSGEVVAAAGRPVVALEPFREAVGQGPGRLPAVLLLDDSGAVAEQQLGGIPADRFGQHDVSFSPGGRWLAETLRDRAGRAPHVIGVWDLDARGRPHAMVDPGDQPFHPVVAGDGRTLYSTGQGALRVTDLTSGKPGRVLGPDDLGVREIGQAIALSPDSGLLAVSASPEIVILDTATMRPIQFLGAPMFSELEFAPKGRRLAGRGGALIVWDLGEDEPRELLAREGEGDGPVALSREGDIVYSLDRGGLLTAWHLDGQGGFLVRTAASLPAIEVTPSGSVPRVSPTGDLVLYARLRPTPMFFVRDVAAGKVISQGAIDQPIKGWMDSAWTPDGKVFSIAMANPTITLWEARVGTPLRQTELPDADEASFSAFTADGRRLLVGTTSGRLHVLDASTLEPVRAPIQVSSSSSGEEAIAKAIANLASSPDGRTALVNLVGQPSRLVDYGTGQVRGLGVDYSVQGGAFSPDGERLFLTGTDGGVGMLDVARQTWIAEPSTAHPFAGWTSAFSPDGTEVASGGARWNGVDGTFLGNVGDMGVTGYSADGRRLIGGEGGGGIVQWDLDPATWVAAACRMAGRDLTAAEWRTILPDRPPQKVCPS